jgi:hypothetical protein
MYCLPRFKPTETLASLSLLMNALNENQTIAVYADVRNAIFAEYFDNRMYLVDLYMDYIASILSTEGLRVDVFADILIQSYTYLINQE